MPRPSAFPVFEKWYAACDWILQTCERMPKHCRFTLGGRIANLALDLTALLTEAIYDRERGPLLRRANLILEQLRIFFRLAHDRRFISLPQYEHAGRLLHEVGSMVGGWQKTLPTT